ncbi:MAG: aminotransferase class III-fold pyridoxal phosphate-dependent enzyme, partial [Candidatus Bathyarchaeia archaeon]
GAHDSVLVKAGSGASTFGAPTSLGIPEDAVKNTIIIPYNNIELLQQVIEHNRQSIAAVIIEPVIGHAGVILPAEGYLQAVRKITEENQIILIFDEVITGFRLALGGAQEYYGIKPDIVTLGKIMGGGFPMAAYAGRRDLMTLISPLGRVYQAGTLSGNPVSVTAGLTTLQILAEKSGSIYPGLDKGGEEIRKSLQDFIQDAELPAQVHGIASMFQVFFTDQPVVDYASAQSSDKNRYMKFHRLLLEKGVFLPPSQFETCFISTAHRAEDIAKTLEAMGSALKTLTS